MHETGWKMMHVLTNAGDQALMIPMEVGVLFVFMLCRCWRMAVAWAVMVLAGSGVMLLLKLYFEACGPARHRVLYSPSGHTMAATMVYGGLLSLTRLDRVSLAVGVLAIAVLEGWTRVALGYHTVVEVMVGGGIGIVMVAGFVAWTPPRQTKFRPILSVLFVVMIVAISMHGWHPNIERTIQSASRLYFSKWECKKPPLHE
ncbi:phosphatase PAP2 family protein [Novacetimonas hansenii]|uniref:Phosphatidic acid phosphatase type 2/haloperoxidase domain-containing protein n=2 Tax=Novacetimonas hansenii TaxID=436 RepID=A0ABQ0SDN2_NOVHA|nr:phosphatase PAP2 family protein [Novacetimonas hansenii]EFG84435.1 phosphoesterase PA-phosphatase related protein [Novacetimonas hansenii ATCC 23769]MBL7238192.1 phosphatase PAP2 family protein [Novacetimonas hansenii]QOF94360.1 phosphatase PAP2 family protein [Novacetimonas hansenii]WEQ59718.1 phosphatase PAP2 family protein [Novacetimonas hansenii]CUW47801.1 PAP2 superfamily protein [Novacetimonas hansenii]